MINTGSFPKAVTGGRKTRRRKASTSVPKKPKSLTSVMKSAMKKKRMMHD